MAVVANGGAAGAGALEVLLGGALPTADQVPAVLDVIVAAAWLRVLLRFRRGGGGRKRQEGVIVLADASEVEEEEESSMLGGVVEESSCMLETKRCRLR